MKKTLLLLLLFITTSTVLTGQIVYTVDTTYTLHYTSIIPDIDGEIDEQWLNYMPFSLNNPDANFDEPDDGSMDFHGSFRSMWDETGIYFLVDVLDNVIVDTSDQFEFMIDPDNSGGTTLNKPGWFSGNTILDFNDVKLSVTLNKVEFNVDARNIGNGFSFGDNLWPGDSSGNTMAVLEKTDGKGYVIEGFISWESLAIDPVNVVEGYQIAMFPQVDDFDLVPDHQVKNAIINTNNNSYGDPTSWINFTLSSEEGQVILSGENSGGQTKNYPASNWVNFIYKTPFAPTIDGDPDEEVWKKIIGQAITPISTNPSVLPKSTDDIVGSFKYLWDDQALYILAEFKDDNVQNAKDVLELIFDPDNSDGYLPSQFSALPPAWLGPVIFDPINDSKFSTNLDGTTLTSDYIMKTDGQPQWGGKHPATITSTVATFVASDSKSYVYEAKIPWADLLIDPASLTDGYEMGFYPQLIDDKDDSTTITVQWGNLENWAWSNPKTLPSLVISTSELNVTAPVVDDPAVLEARFEFNEAEGTTTNDVDSNYTGTFENNPQWASEGIDGSSISFKDSSFVMTDYSGVLGDEQFSISGWIKTTTPDKIFLAWGKESFLSKIEIKTTGAGQLRIQFYGGGFAGQTNIADGKWHHVAIVRGAEGSADMGLTKLYVDGKLDNVGAVRNQVVNVGDSIKIHFGASVVPAVNNYFTGNLDQFAFYTGALTDAEITKLYSDELKRLVDSNQPAELVALFELNENTGTVTKDQTNQYNGNLVNNPLWVSGVETQGAAVSFADSAYVLTDVSGPAGLSQFSISGWVKTDSLNKTILGWGYENLYSKVEMKTDGAGKFRVQYYGGGFQGATPINDGNWHHVTFVRDGEAVANMGKGKLYVDGKLDRQPASNGHVVNILDSVKFHFGGSIVPTTRPASGGKSTYFNGTLDRIAIYDGALTAEQVDSLYQEFVVSDVDDLNGLPLTYNLNQNYPNPFNPSTVISYSLPKSGLVKLEVFNLLGQKVADLVNMEQTAGNHKIEFDGSKLASGVYMYRINVNNNFISTKKMMLIK